jgi:hypothetical protein
MSSIKLAKNRSNQRTTIVSPLPRLPRLDRLLTIHLTNDLVAPLLIGKYDHLERQNASTNRGSVMSR